MPVLVLLKLTVHVLVLLKLGTRFNVDTFAAFYKILTVEFRTDSLPYEYICPNARQARTKC